MRTWILGAVMVVVLIASYWAFALFGTSQVAAAAASANPDELMQKIDVTQLRHSLAHQIVGAYLRQNPKTQHLSGIAASFAGALGGTVADDMLKDLLTPQNLASLLDKGQVSRGSDKISIKVPALGDMFKTSSWQVLASAYFDGPLDFVVDLGRGDDAYGVHLSLEGIDWRVTGLDLPPSLVDNLAREITARQQKTG